MFRVIIILNTIALRIVRHTYNNVESYLKKLYINVRLNIKPPIDKSSLNPLSNKKSNKERAKFKLHDTNVS